jgi:hypothetical protein
MDQRTARLGVASRYGSGPAQLCSGDPRRQSLRLAVVPLDGLADWGW